MAVHVRLARHGSTHRPFYHVVATDHRDRRDGRFIEKLGTYNPHTEPSTLNIKTERVQYWYNNGAQLSPTVNTLLRKNNIALESRSKGTKKS